jgi:hypothetical protein
VYLLPTFAWAQTCGDTICDDFAGECQTCPEDCQNADSEALCLTNDEGDDGVCTDDATLLGYPEVSEDGFGCNDPQCPSFEAFCADPAHAGMGVTLCSQALRCDQGGGTPVECPCIPTTNECSEIEVVDNCNNDCDCIGNERGGLCEETQCGWQCSLKCQNRRNITFNGAFSSCQMVCPTTRLPEQAGVENEHVRRYINALPDYCLGASNCGAEGVDIPESGTPQQAEQSCDIYRRLNACFTDCSDCSRNRLSGYFQICAGIRGLTNGPTSPDYPEDFPARYNQCAQSSAFQEYADEMMFCLQAKATAGANGCPSCDVLVNGLPSIDIESGIIGAHTDCNNTSGFCELIDAPGGVPLSCFGAGLGRAWGSILGHHSPLGPIQSVGICHMVSQMLACANGDGDRLVEWQNQVCEGFVDGCMTRSNLGDIFPQCTLDVGSLLAAGMSISEAHALIDRCNSNARRTFCQASCPVNSIMDWIIELIGEVPFGEAGALKFEETCNQIIAGDLFPFGSGVFLPPIITFPIGFPLPEIPGFESGRDPCLTY